MVKAAKVKAMEDAERGTSVPQPKMTQTSKKVTKDLRMDRFWTWKSQGQSRQLTGMPLVSCARLTLYSVETCSYSVHPGWLVWRTDESYQVAKADGCRTSYNKKKEY